MTLRGGSRKTDVFFKFVDEDGETTVESNADQVVVDHAVTTSLSSFPPPSLGPTETLSSGARRVLIGLERQRRAADLQKKAKQTPSPNNYEVALHGLLALGSSTELQHTGLAQNDWSEQPVVPRPDNAPATPRASVQREQENQGLSAMQGTTSWQSSDLAQESPLEHNYASVATVETGHGASYANEPDSAVKTMPGVWQGRYPSTQRRIGSKFAPADWTPLLDTVTREMSLDLLRYYRYHIAPWVWMVLL